MGKGPMDNPLPLTIAADCGCSLTACHEAIIQSPNPRQHIQTGIRLVMEHEFMADDVRVGFCRMLDLKEQVLTNEGRNLWVMLPDNWEKTFRRAIREEPASFDEKLQVYRLLGMGKPSAAERNSWALASAAQSGMPYDHETENYVSGSLLQHPPLSLQWTSNTPHRGQFGDPAPNPLSMHNPPGSSGSGRFPEGWSNDPASQ